MSFEWARAFVFFLPVAFILVALWRRRRVEAKARETDVRLALDRADLFALQGAWPAAEELARPVAVEMKRKGAAGLELAARAHLVLAECEAGLDRRDAAIHELAEAARLRALIPDAAVAQTLRSGERVFEAGLGNSGAGAERSFAAADAVLADDALIAAADPTRLIRLARLAIWRADAETREGSWPRARAHLEQSVTLGERVEIAAPTGAFGPARERALLLGELARSRAASAAGEIGQVLASLGRREEALEWLDRAVDTIAAATLPPGKIARSRAMVIRAMHEPADAVFGFEPRRRRLVAARDVVEAHEWPAARALAARAEIQLGVLAAQEGAPEKARDHFVEAQRRLTGLELPGVAELVAESHLLLAHVHEDHGALDDARAGYRRAFDAGREDADADARRLACVSGCHLHRLLHHADRSDEARTLLEPLEALTPTLAPPARALIAAMVARCRGQQQFRDGDRTAADRTLREAMALIETAEGPEAADLARQISTERGHLALAAEAPAEAEAHFRHALVTRTGSRPEAIEQAERAEVRLRLAQAMLQQDRSREALPELHAAFEAGKGSGRASGRAVAAAAALTLGDDPEAPLPERRAWYESAARFGRLSGTPRGRQVEEAVAERLRELTE